MSGIDDGGPAFMVAELANISHNGMTLRDYFAARAMQALIPDGGRADSTKAREAYAMADAMIAARDAK